MPLYEYKCLSCGENFELIQKFSDHPLAVHEKCGGAVERLISVPALQFKGSGWYVTDYGKGNAKTPATAGDGSNGAEKKESAKSESGKSESSSTSSSNASSSGSTPAPVTASKSESK